MNCRNTPQKLKILEYLKSVKTHPTAEMVHAAVKKEIPTITLATVYRNLNKMAEHGEILRLEINSEYHYDGNTCAHQHCVCGKCNKICNSFQEEISRQALKKFSQQDFAANCVCIMFHGTCKKCGGR
ncbi:MAG: transcriptional repressor [archaeon]